MCFTKIAFFVSFSDIEGFSIFWDSVGERADGDDDSALFLFYRFFVVNHEVIAILFYN